LRRKAGIDDVDGMSDVGNPKRRFAPAANGLASRGDLLDGDSIRDAAR
jgi:hypothetical protein